MRCYFAGSSNPYEYPFVEACFANSHKEAKGFMWKHSHRLSEECDSDYMDLRVNRQKDYDKLYDESKTEPYLVTNPETLRIMGWSMEGERECDCCGLAAMGIDEHEVCDSCGQCSECGFDEECQEHGDNQ